MSLIDLMPTALELLGIDMPNQGQGRSVADAVRGLALSERDYFAETRVPYAHKPSESTPKASSQHTRVSIYSGRYKLTLNPLGRAEIYDLLADPGEQSLIEPSLHLQELTAFREMETRARAHQALTKQALQRLSPEPDPETLRGLRILGYLD